ncbi:MAG: hypothetical protein ABI645_03840 [Pseudomonadota bacterium]
MKKLIIAGAALCGALAVFAAAPGPGAGTPPGAGAAPARGGFLRGLVVPVCTRASLQAAVDSYLAAQKAGDVKKIAFDDKATYRENMSAVDPAKGLWNTKLTIAFQRSFLDSKRCRTFSEVIVTEGGHPYVIGTRLYVDAGKVTRIDSLVTDQGDWLFNAEDYLKYSRAENWSMKPEQRTSEEAMINGANAYLDFFSDKFHEAPWGQPCARLEGGAYTNKTKDTEDASTSCKVGIPNGVLYIVNRDYIVDEVQGVINVFCRFGDSKTGMPDSHTFAYRNGKYRWVHTLSVQLNPPAAVSAGGMNGAAPPAARPAAPQR